jgi:cell division protein FtsW (lipid II flippase)
VGSYAVSQAVPHVRERVDIWLNPYQHAESSGYQILQSLYSIAHGGFGGTGLGRGIVTGPTGQQVVPDLNTDFIYSAVAQELGLIGAAAVLLLYMAFVLRGFRIALAASDGFSKLLAAGLSFSFAFQTFVIVGGITRVIPLTGITLPFVSYGGSSVVANFLLVAGLLLISHRANRQEASA